MVAKALFIIAFIIFSSLSLFVDLPPGPVITNLMNVSSAPYTFLTNNVLNGIVYGTIIALAAYLVRRNTKPPIPRYVPYATSTASSLDDEIKELLKVHGSKTGSTLTEIKGIGSTRALELELAGVKTVADLAKRSPKHLAEKTGIPITQISKWILEANRIIK